MGYSKSKRVLRRFENELQLLGHSRHTETFNVDSGTEDWTCAKFREARAVLRKDPGAMANGKAILDALEGYEFRLSKPGEIVAYWKGVRGINATPASPTSPTSKAAIFTVSGVNTLDEAIQAYINYYDPNNLATVILENHALPDSDLIRLANWASRFDSRLAVLRSRDNVVSIGVPDASTPQSMVVLPAILEL